MAKVTGNGASIRLAAGITAVSDATNFSSVLSGFGHAAVPKIADGIQLSDVSATKANYDNYQQCRAR